MAKSNGSRPNSFCSSTDFFISSIVNHFLWAVCSQNKMMRPGVSLFWDLLNLASRTTAKVTKEKFSILDKFSCMTTILLTCSAIRTRIGWARKVTLVDSATLGWRFDWNCRIPCSLTRVLATCEVKKGNILDTIIILIIISALLN